MIVKDPQKTIEYAHKFAIEVIDRIMKSNFECEDDPAEYIYLYVHICAKLTSLMLMTIEAYGNVYGMENLNHITIHGWINKLVKEYLDIKEKITNEIKESDEEIN